MPLMSEPVEIGPEWLFRRQMGFKSPLGSLDEYARQMYHSLQTETLYDTDHNQGGIFSLEYSPEGSVLVAACERRSILIFDPLNPRLRHTVEAAHEDCVNCIKFIDSRLFATCSDDYTVALWDIRNLKSKLLDLRRHENWVKSIEYSAKDKLLVTSGFDGSVLAWELANNSEMGNTCKKVFSMNGLMRTRLSADGSKMVMSTTAGYILVIHNLDLKTLRSDLGSFKPNMYRLMQMSQTLLTSTSDFTHLFRGPGRRNRVEFLCDFPDGNDAEVIASIQIHPEGHSVLSRNTSHDETSEWTCVHSIEENLSSHESESDCGGEQVRWPEGITKSKPPSFILRSNFHHTEDSPESESDRRDLTFSPVDVWEAMIAIQDARIRRTRGAISPESLQQEHEEEERLLEQEEEEDRLQERRARELERARRRRHRAEIRRALHMDESSESATTGSDGSRCVHVTLSRGDPGEGTSQQSGDRRQTTRRGRTFKRATGCDGGNGQHQRTNLTTRFELNETARLQNRWTRGAALRSLEDADSREGDISLSPRRGAPAAGGTPEVVLPLGIFRRDGGRGTSMRRHNIATLTIASDGDSDGDARPTEVSEASARNALDPAHDLTRVVVNKKVHQNLRRLTHYRREPNVVSGFIKEPCYSPDGRVICSPYKLGIRLLAYSPALERPWQCFPDDPPVPLYQVMSTSFGSCTDDAVVSSRFSPLDNQLAVGCLSGKIYLFNPFR